MRFFPALSKSDTSLHRSHSRQVYRPLGFGIKVREFNDQFIMEHVRGKYIIAETSCCEDKVLAGMPGLYKDTPVAPVAQGPC